MTRRPARPRFSSVGGALLLGWVLLAPALATATAAPASLLPPEAPARELHLLDAPVDGAQAVGKRPSSETRILTELGVGTLTGLGMGVLVGLTAGDGDLLSPAALLGASLAFPLGVWMGGTLTGGQGWLLATLAGGLPSLLVAIAPERRLGGGIGKEGWLILSALFMVPGLSVAAYELSDNYEYERSRRAAPRLQVQPLLGASSEHALLGLQGRF